MGIMLFHCILALMHHHNTDLNLNRTIYKCNPALHSKVSSTCMQVCFVLQPPICAFEIILFHSSWPMAISAKQYGKYRMPNFKVFVPFAKFIVELLKNKKHSIHL